MYFLDLTQVYYRRLLFSYFTTGIVTLLKLHLFDTQTICRKTIKTNTHLFTAVVKVGSLDSSCFVVC